jgi:hypothetical protein
VQYKFFGKGHFLENVVNNWRRDSGNVQKIDRVGSILQGRYQILEQLGSAGVVTTYLGVDLQLSGIDPLKCVVHCYYFPDLPANSFYWERAGLAAQIFKEVGHAIDRLPSV